MPFRGLLQAVLSLAVVLCAMSAVAQQKSEKAPLAATGPQPTAPEPEVTTATFGDWVLKCQRLPEETKPGRMCEVVHQVVVDGQPGPILQLAIGKPQPEVNRLLVVVLPSNVLLTRAPEIAASNQSAVLSTTWRRCVPGACVADVEYSDRLATQEQGGVVRFTNANNRPVEVPFSTRGLKQALDALSRS